jgi:DNA-binding PadR family transcriptional regulator
MHGYEIIAELSQRTEGLWRPSPGSIYPTLQLLEDEGLITVQPDDAGGKKRFSLTEEGQRAAAEVGKGQAPWEQVAAGAPAGARALRHAVGRLMPVVGQVAMSGGLREYEEAAKIIDEARRRLYAVLAGDQVRPGPGTGEGTDEPSGPPG